MSAKQTKQAFLWIVDILRKYKIPFRISGGFAARIYGSNRQLADIDIDIPDKYFSILLADTRKYIIVGPKNYKDKEWDIFAITLKYKGQIIDIVGSDAPKIFDKNKKRWISYNVNYNMSFKKKIYKKIVPIISKKDLISYKRKIKRRVDVQDIKQLLSE